MRLWGSVAHGLLAGALATTMGALVMLGWNVVREGRAFADLGTAAVFGIILGVARASAAWRLESRRA